MLTTSLFKGANLSGIQLRDEIALLGIRKYGLEEDDARREAERVVEDMAASRETNDSKIIHGAYSSHGYLLLQKRLELRGLLKKTSSI